MGSIWAENSAAHGLDVRDATFDKRVMEFALSIPDREYTGPDGTDRWMIRAAMQGLMPDDVRLNRRLGMQAADVGQRLIDSRRRGGTGTWTSWKAQSWRSSIWTSPACAQSWESLQKEIGPQTTHASITILTRAASWRACISWIERWRAEGSDPFLSRFRLVAGIGNRVP